jgi:hypothetical protein
MQTAFPNASAAGCVGLYDKGEKQACLHQCSKRKPHHQSLQQLIALLQAVILTTRTSCVCSDYATTCATSKLCLNNLQLSMHKLQ